MGSWRWSAPQTDLDAEEGAPEQKPLAWKIRPADSYPSIHPIPPAPCLKIKGLKQERRCFARLRYPSIFPPPRARRLHATDPAAYTRFPTTRCAGARPSYRTVPRAGSMAIEGTKTDGALIDSDGHRRAPRVCRCKREMEGDGSELSGRVIGTDRRESTICAGRAGSMVEYRSGGSRACVFAMLSAPPLMRRPLWRGPRGRNACVARGAEWTLEDLRTWRDRGGSGPSSACPLPLSS
ncbi:hypothetical protein K438DRAFT_1824519 [Mycena galopus ATCC 62051]|nr:hypothetical protein K438DRAFT_1824519 [Mycena galopus ATCC 62051]